VAKGKKLHDKRESEKKRDWGREKGRLLRARGKATTMPIVIARSTCDEAIHLYAR